MQTHLIILTNIESDMKNKFLLLVFLLAVFAAGSLSSQIKSIKLVVSLTGSVIDHHTRDYVTIRYEVFDTSGKRIARGRSNSAEKGYYFITGLKPGQQYTIKFFDMAYLRTEYRFDIPYTDKYAEYSKDFLVVPRKKDIKIFISVPPFELGKTKLRYGIDDYLDFYAKIVARNPRIKFEIQCFPDTPADLDKNIVLTEGRANSLKNFFINKGAKPEKVTTKGFADTDKLHPPPVKKRSKGKRYIGSSYLMVLRLK